MESKSNNSPHVKFPYPNLQQSLHIGCMDYDGINSTEFGKIQASYEDVNNYEEFFKNVLKFDKNG